MLAKASTLAALLPLALASPAANSFELWARALPDQSSFVQGNITQTLQDIITLNNTVNTYGYNENDIGLKALTTYQNAQAIQNDLNATTIAATGSAVFTDTESRDIYLSLAGILSPVFTLLDNLVAHCNTYNNVGVKSIVLSSLQSQRDLTTQEGNAIQAKMAGTYPQSIAFGTGLILSRFDSAIGIFGASSCPPPGSTAFASGSGGGGGGATATSTVTSTQTVAGPTVTSTVTATAAAQPAQTITQTKTVSATVTQAAQTVTQVSTATITLPAQTQTKTATVTQAGAAQTVTVAGPASTVTLPGGTVTVTQAGAAQTVTVTQPGAAQTVTVTQPGAAQTVTVTQAGAAQTVTVTQAGAAQTVTVTQQAAAQTVTVTQQAGPAQTVTVTQQAGGGATLTQTITQPAQTVTKGTTVTGPASTVTLNCSVQKCAPLEPCWFSSVLGQGRATTTTVCTTATPKPRA